MNRFYLLLRTYFYEFFRIREIFNRFINTLKVNELIDKNKAKIIRDTFYDAFKDSIKIRNFLVHTNFQCEGRRHVDLILTDCCHHFGRIQYDLK